MKKSAIVLLFVAGVSACGSNDAKSEATDPNKPASTGAAASAPAGNAQAGSKNVDRKPTADFSGDEAGAKKLLSRFLDPAVGPADKKALTAALQPDSADYAAVFMPEAAAKIEASNAPIWSSGEAMSGKEGQTELLLSSASTDDFKAWNDKADNFPGGYKKIADKLKPGVVLYRWKFVKPGEKLGMAFDGLAHVNGHWVWFPKPWRSMDGQ